MISDHENVICPDAPLFLVARGWLKDSSSSKRAWAGNFRSQSIYGVSVQTSIPTKGLRTNKASAQSVVRGQRSGKTRSGPVKYTNKSSKESPTKIHRAHYASSTLPCPVFFSNAIEAVKGVKGFETFIHYYPDVLTAVVYPIQGRLCVENNTARHLWFPLALNDSLLLKAFIWVSVSHCAIHNKTPEPPKLENLFHSIVELLNQRVQSGNFSNATIGAVSCLVLAEKWRGNMALALTHLRGMASMLRHRQQTSPLPRAYATKIWKADIVHSADMLHRPVLPRPPPGVSQATEKVSPNIPQLHNVCSALSTIFGTLRKLCHLVDDLWRKNGVLAMEDFVSDIFGVQYDLLNLETTTELDEAVRLALIIFSKPLIRVLPYTFSASQVVTRRLKMALELADGHLIDAQLKLWLYIIGYIASHETAEREWFGTQLISILVASGITFDWKALKEQLNQIIWTSAFHDDFGYVLCYELYRQSFSELVI